MDENKYLDKVINLFKAKGLSMSMEEIAQGIGVTKKTLYNRFENKEELLTKCIAQIQQNLRDCLDQMNNPETDVTEAFAHGINTLRNFFREMSPVFLHDLMKLYPIMANDDHEFGSAYFIKSLLNNIEQGQADGTYRKEIDAKLTAEYISFSIFAFFRKYVMMSGDYSADFYFHQIIDYNLHALTNRGK